MRTGPDPAKAKGRFLVSRWRGRVPLDRLLLFDILIAGTLLNLAASFAALMAFGFKAPTWVAVTLHLAPLPYSLFLVLCLWRATDDASAASASVYRLTALGWLVLALVI